MVLLEDSAALLGLLFTLAGVGLATITTNGRFDAVGSLAIGVLLVVIAWLLAGEMKSFLIGESAGAADLASIRSVIESIHTSTVWSGCAPSSSVPRSCCWGAQVKLRFADLTAPEVAAALTEASKLRSVVGCSAARRLPHAGRGGRCALNGRGTLTRCAE